MSKKNTSKRIQIYSALEVANMCGVVNQTAINWIRNGHLKAFNTPGGQYRVYKDDLIDFVEKRGMRIPEALLVSDEPEADWRTVIIIDDDPVLNNAVSSYIKKNMPEHKVIQSFDGFDAGAQLAEKKPGFVILDIALPGVNGQDLCQRIKTDPAFGKPYIMIITGLDDADLEAKMFSLGADCFFRKPLTLSKITEAIDKAMENT